jgi:TonB family protein
MRIILLFIVISLTSCKVAEWPSENFIKKYNYIEVAGDQSVPDSSKKLDICKGIVIYPKYPNGTVGICDHISKTYSYPQKALHDKIEGKVVVSYIVELDGFVGEIQIIKSVDPLLDQEAIRIIKCMRRWIPGSCDGVISRFQFIQPFNFKVKQNILETLGH